MKKIYTKTKACLYAVFFIISVLIVFVFFFFTKSQNTIWHIRKIWAKIQIKILKIKIKLHGHFDDTCKILIINHQSMLDIIALEAMYPKNLAWIAKKELSQIPIFKMAMTKPKLLCIDRQNPRDLIRILKEAKERISENRILAIFPEGTRNQNDTMLPFQNGVKILSEKLNIKAQPIVIVDSAKFLDSKNLSLNSGTLHIIALDSINMNDENWLENTRALMQNILDEKRTKL